MRLSMAICAVLTVLATLAIPLSASAQALEPRSASDVRGRFSLEVNGANAGFFSELHIGASGITLTHGTSVSTQLLSWRQTVLDGKLAASQRTATVIAYNTDGKPVARYNLEHAWPSKLDTSTADSAKNEVSIETLELQSDMSPRTS
jgi:phage tail-like protein